MTKKIRNSFILLLIFFLLIIPNLSNAMIEKEITSTITIARPVIGTDAAGGAGDYSTDTSDDQNPITNPEQYNPWDDGDDDEIEQDAQFIAEKAGVIMNVIFVVGVIVSVLSLMIMGIKYMVGSVEEKAEYKKSMIPYFVGIFFIVGITAIVKIISSITSSMFQ